MHKRMKSVSLMMLMMSLSASAIYAHPTSSEVLNVQQTSVLKGVVKDASGMALIGASVFVKGTNNGVVVMNDDGSFELKGVKKGATIKVSYIGYESQELVWDGGSMSIELKEVDNALGEAVVIGYGVAKKSDMTGAVTAIKPDDKNKGVVVNAQDMIQGKIAGVNVTTNSGTPGAGAAIRIRGGSSLNASNDPLIVIDGLAMDNNGVKGLSNPLSMVNPADIESFTVLKDASATAIYGSRGSNGVIIITTKKGRAGMRTKVTYNGNMTVSSKHKTLDVMTGDEFREFVKAQYGEGSDAYKKLGQENTDWQSQIYRTAISHDHNVTVAGGIGKMPFRASFGYTNQAGILKTSNFERYTGSLNLNPSFLEDHLTVNVSTKYMFAKTRFANTEAVGAAVSFDPTQPVRSYDPAFANFKHYFQWTQPGDALSDINWPETWNGRATRNPVSLLDLKDDRAKSNAFVGNLELDYKVHGFEDLRLHMNLGADYSSGKQTTVTDIASPENIYYGWNGWEKIDKYNLSFNAYAQYMKELNENHRFDIMAGYEWQHFHRKGVGNGSGFTQPGHYHEVEVEVPVDPSDPTKGTKKVKEKVLDPVTAVNPSVTNWVTENYLVSFFGRANYSLYDRYLLTATFRYDGSSRFEKHWALFPSFAFGWKIKNEAFLKDVEAVSDLKLRLGYGQTGQQEGIGDYNYFSSYNTNLSPDSYYPILGAGKIDRPNAINRSLTWETTSTYNVGIDFGFANQRFTGSLDYYYRKTTDLLNTVYVAAGSNFRNQVSSNVGSLANQGVELALNWKAIQQRDLFLDLGFNLTYNKNEITELIGGKDYYVPTGGISAGTGNTAQAHAVGYPASSYYVYQQVYDKNGVPMEGVYVDRDGDGKITTNDKYFYKNPMAPWTAGFTAKLQYKNWDLSTSLRASIGNYVFNDQEASQSNSATTWINSYLSNRPTDALAKRWATYDNVLSDYFVQNGSFLKCENITLGYSFDNLFKCKSYEGISGRLYLTASNVFTITKYKGIDPEVITKNKERDSEVVIGIDNNLYPRPFSLVAGVTLNF
ncbi:MAG: TonB-dependent receptor [Bacteroidaceae bacterium]|nr:TonB-dependent receptor [Bacteroidaceae bacterium]